MYKSVLIGLIDILYDKDEFYSCKISTQMSNDNYDDNSILLTLKSNHSLPIFFTNLFSQFILSFLPVYQHSGARSLFAQLTLSDK